MASETRLRPACGLLVKQAQITKDTSTAFEDAAGTQVVGGLHDGVLVREAVAQ